MVTYLFPSDPLSGRSLRVDEHFAAEYAAALELGSVGILDSYTLQESKPRMVFKEGSDTKVIYRGWMMASEEYAALSRALGDRGYDLLTTLPAYLETHSIEGWADRFEGLTAPTAIFDPSTMDASEAVALAESVAPEGSYFLKGVSKSEPALSRAEGADELLDRLAALGESLGETERIAIRRYEALDSTVAELRSWWAHGWLVWIDLHPNFLSESLRDPLGEPDAVLMNSALDFTAALGPAIGELQSNFLTADFALKADGSWTLIEIGDGQVSGLRQDWDEAQVHEFYGKLVELNRR